MRIIGMAINICQKLRSGKFPFHHIAFQLGHIDAIGGKSTQRFIQSCGDVAHTKHKSRDKRIMTTIRPVCRFRQNDKAGRIMGLVLDIFGQYIKTIDFCCQGRCQRAFCFVQPFGNFPR